MKIFFKKITACIALIALLSSHIVIAENKGETYYFDSKNAKEFQDMNFDNFRYVPGDKIVFKAGTIKIKDVGRWGKINYMYGTKEKPIIIEGEVGPNGELLTTLDGEGFDLYGDGSNSRDLLGIENGQYVIIRNLRFINSWNSTGNAGGIRFVAGDNLVVENCYFENTQNGVFSYNSGKVTIKNSFFHRAGYFNEDGGGHATYLDAKEVYFIGNHVKNSQFHSFRTRASFTYVENNYIENDGNTPVSLFGGNNSDDPNSNIVFIGNIIIKNPSQRDDGLPGNKRQFIQIGERHTPFHFYAYNNTFILDQDKASDTGSDQKNFARLMMYSDAQTNSNAKSYIKNNIIYGSDKLADEGKAGSYTEFENNIYMSGSQIPSTWTATGNLSITGSEVFNNYSINTNNALSIDGLKLKDESILNPISAENLKFIDRNGIEHNLSNGLYNETNFSYKFEKGPRQMKSFQSDVINRCSLKSVGFGENNPDSNCTYSDSVDPEIKIPKTFSGFTVVGDTKKYNSLSEVPSGKWLEIENTKLRDVLSPRSYSMILYRGSGPSSIMGARSSAAFDTNREKMYVFGGGNNDYAGNEVYSFDLNNMWWERLTDPAFPSQGQALMMSGSHRYFDGSLPARNTFDMIEYDSKNDQMCALGEYGVYPTGRGGNEVNCFKPSSNSWVQKKDLTVRTIAVGTSVYDEKSGHFYEFDNDTSSFYEYDPNSDTWITHKLDNNYQYGGFTSEIDSENRNMLMVNNSKVVLVPLPAIGSTGSTIKTNSYTLFGTGDLARYPGVSFDKVAQKFIVWGGGKYLYAINSASGSVEKITSLGEANPLSAISAGTYGRFRYSAKYDAYILANGIDTNIWIYKPDRTQANKIGTPCTDLTCVNSNPITTPETGGGNTSSGTTQTGTTSTGTSNELGGTTYTFDKENFFTFRDKFFNNLQTKPGDKFVFKAGNYSIKTLAGTWPKINNLSGSINNPIIIEGEVGANGELLTTLDGAGFDLGGAGSNARDLLDIENSNYVIVRNLKLKNAAGNSGNSAGIRFIGGDNLVVDNCEFENDQNGVFAYGSNRLTVKNSYFNRSGHFSPSGGGHGVYIEVSELYFVGNHMYNSQMHNFRSRAGFTYMQNNYIENADNTEVSLFGGATTKDANANFVMVGNVIIKKPSQRSDGLPGNSSQFIQIGERTTPFNVYAYNNTFILDQTVASDNGVSQKNDAGLFMFSDTNTHNNAKVFIKSNVIYGSNKLSFSGKQGKIGEFQNNIYVSGSAIPSGRTATGNLAINDSSIFKNYVVNSNNALTLSGLLLKDESILKPMWSGKLSFVDKSGNTHYLSNGLYNSDENFTYKFDRALTQMTEKQSSKSPRTVIKSVGYGQNISPKTFSGFKVVGDSKIYNSPSELGTGKWFEIDNTKMAQVFDRDFYEAPVRAIVGPWSIMGAWGGAAFDTKRERFYLFGGGHGDYAGNDVYSFDVNTMNWERLKDPSIPPDGVNIKDETTGKNYDGSPVSRHTYDMLEYDPVTDQMCTLGESAVYPSGGGGLHIYCFDPKTNNWNTKKDLVGGSFAYGHAVYDPSDEMFYAFSAAGAHFGQYNPKTDTWKITRTQFSDIPNYANNTSFPLYFNADLDPETRTMVLSDSNSIFSIKLPETNFGINEMPKAIFSTGVYDKVANTYTGITAYPGFIYDPVIKKFVTWNEGKKFYYYDPKTKEVTYEDTIGSEKIMPNDTHGWYGRFRYSAKYDMYVLLNGSNENVFVYKPDRKGAVIVKPTPPVINPGTGTGNTQTGTTDSSSGTTQSGSIIKNPVSSGGGGGGGGGSSSSSSRNKAVISNTVTYSGTTSAQTIAGKSPDEKKQYIKALKQKLIEQRIQAHQKQNAVQKTNKVLSTQERSALLERYKIFNQAKRLYEQKQDRISKNQMIKQQILLKNLMSKFFQ